MLQCLNGIRSVSLLRLHTICFYSVYFWFVRVTLQITISIIIIIMSHSGGTHPPNNNVPKYDKDSDKEKEFDYKKFRAEFRRGKLEKRYEDCERLCLQAIQNCPPNQLRAKVYNHLGYLYENCIEGKHFDDVLEHYVLALQVDDTSVSAHFNLANFLLEQGLQHLARALELNPNHRKTQQRLASLQSFGGGHVV
ncbi:hypothetical protein RFI_04569 [Reticulomyxa filosa]|uniref:Uncharacterized protein n=1 Tax=Reticulomyxa filosa TaxID=46433 RepID=X6P392_RETFI|nr:hypothetical protein RFI_04569 [Reticulomyxa filosa]|eukprot:ETO32549.1 hypothetical protein RFI_04569 [Reticulomyxa filosa]